MRLPTVERGCLMFLLGVFVWREVAQRIDAYAPVDEDTICRLIRLDETALVIPQNKSYGATPSITLVDDRDLTSLLEGDSTLGQNATVRLDVQVPDEDQGVCVPYSLILTAGSGGLTVPLPPPERGWRPGAWHSIIAPILPDAYKDANKAAWADLTRLELDFNCEKPVLVPDASIKIQLVRICKNLVSPSYCTVESTDVYKTECHNCNCQTCHDCSCLITLVGHCQWDACEDCLCAPLCKCCYESNCGYTCNCETCCEDRSFTSCSKAISYGVQSITPSGGPEQGGTRVVISSTSTFIDTPHLACRFGNAVVKGILLSSNQLVCTSPEAPGISTRNVAVEVSLDGQHWTDDRHVFKYCKAGENCVSSCEKGWKGTNCSIECLGGAVNPCSGHGLCLDDPPGTCVCQPGYRGQACDEVGGGGQIPAAAEDHISESEIDKEANASKRGAAYKQGLALGVGLSFLALLIASIAIYIKRAEVTEYIYWTLAQTRFQRLHQDSPMTTDGTSSGGRGSSSIHSQSSRSAFELGPVRGGRGGSVGGDTGSSSSNVEHPHHEVNFMRHAGGRPRMGGSVGYSHLQRGPGEESELLEASRVAERLEHLEGDEDMTVI